MKHTTLSHAYAHWHELNEICSIESNWYTPQYCNLCFDFCKSVSCGYATWLWYFCAGARRVTTRWHMNTQIPALLTSQLTTMQTNLISSYKMTSCLSRIVTHGDLSVMGMATHWAEEALTIHVYLFLLFQLTITLFLMRNLYITGMEMSRVYPN